MQFITINERSRRRIQPHRGHAAPSPRAFTLVELLVVIAIVSLLMAILMPSLQKARDTSHRARCAASVRMFMTGLFTYITDDNETIPAHYADNINWDGNSFNALPTMSSRQYVNVATMICPTAPPVYRYKYTSNTNPWNKNDSWFKPFYEQTGVYNVPFGTYYYNFGANEENASSLTQAYRIWDTYMDGVPKFQMKSSHIGSPSQYSGIWDQDFRRNYGSDPDIVQRSSHQVTPGRTFAFYDGHVRFYADSDPEVASCTLTNWFKGTEHITPFVNGYILYYYRAASGHGSNANLAGTPNPRPNALSQNILRMPGG